MGIDRRQFLKVAGLSTLVGLGGSSAFELLRPGQLDASEAGAQKPAHGAGHEAAIEPAGKRWGMIVDMSKNEDWQTCINACHKNHNVPDVGNPKEEIKWIWLAPFGQAFPSEEHEYLRESFAKNPFLLLCNHCENPPCVRVCPTKATFKRPEDGIVMMDMHRCIGCRFCMAGCPYGSRSFNWRDPRNYITKANPEYPTRERGVVEKCTFCVELVEKGKQPLCVEACKNGGLVFGDLHDPHSEIRNILRTKTAIRRKPEAGTNPSVFYLV